MNIVTQTNVRHTAAISSLPVNAVARFWLSSCHVFVATLTLLSLLEHGSLNEILRLYALLCELLT